jgi:hypothetical protein
MRSFVIVVAMLGAGCGGSGVTVPCGNATCGPFEYCHVQCTCCGVPTGGDSGLTPAATQECRPIPVGCTGANLCGCASLPSGGCDPAKRLFEVPCA